MLEIDTPISVALDLQFLKQSDNPEQRSLADILSALSEIRTSIASIEQRISDGEPLGSREFSYRFADYLIHDPNSIKWLQLKPSESWGEKLTLEQIDLLSKYVESLKFQAQHRELNKKQQRKIQEAKKSDSEDKGKET